MIVFKTKKEFSHFAVESPRVTPSFMTIKVEEATMSIKVEKLQRFLSIYCVMTNEVIFPPILDRLIFSFQVL